MDRALLWALFRALGGLYEGTGVADFGGPGRTSVEPE